nr:hypothetical protein [Candidatus Cloacimonadota bacterium]
MRIILFLIVTLLMSSMLWAETKFDPTEFWQDGYCVQTTAKTPDPGSKTIQAQLEGEWHTLDLVDFPSSFWEWNRLRRTEYLDVFRQMITNGERQEPRLAGPHNGIVASWGMARNDSQFKLNNAVKGSGLLPKAEKLAEITRLLESNIESDMLTKLNVLDSLYQNAEEIFSPNQIVSLELYSEPGYNTQTFINQMVNPACVTVYLDIPSYKIKQIARILHPADPNLSNYEKAVVRYVNLMHSFFHGEFPRDFIAVIYYNIEIYDNSPGAKDARGTKISP